MRFLLQFFFINHQFFPAANDFISGILIPHPQKLKILENIHTARCTFRVIDSKIKMTMGDRFLIFPDIYIYQGATCIKFSTGEVSMTPAINFLLVSMKTILDCLLLKMNIY
jgi:hypothetical protein